MSIQFGDILRHNNPNYPIADVSDIRGGLRSIATFSGDSLISEYTSGDGGSIIPEKYKSGYSLLLETSTGTIYYYSGIDPTNVNHWTSIGIGGNGVTNTIPKWISASKLGNSSITDNGDTVVISSNLMVIGTTSTVNTENLLVKDPIILLAGSQSGIPIFDAGLFVNRGSSDTQAFIWDESQKEFKFISTTSSATTSGNVSIGTYSSVRTGILKVGTSDVDSNDRFIVSSSGGTVSLVVDEFGNVYNQGSSKSNYNTAFGYGSQTNSPYGGISVKSIIGGFGYDDGWYYSIVMELYSGPVPITYPIVNIYVEDGTVQQVVIVTNGTGFTSTSTQLTADLGSGSGFYITIDLTSLRNTSFGYNSLISNSGNNNSAFGYNSLISNSGNNNSAFGYSSLYSNTNGYSNLAIGASSSSLNTSGFDNIAIGVQSLYSNTIGYSNLAIGVQSLYSNISGAYNIAIGYQSLYKSKSYYNTAIGFQTSYNTVNGSYNTAIGYNSLFGNISGSFNTAVGYQSLSSGTNSSSNTAVGYQSLLQNRGSTNTAIGNQSLSGNTTGSLNVGVGYSPLVINTTGYENTALGNESLRNNSIGYQNTAVGQQALYNNTTADNGVAVGNSSLYKNNTGKWNTALGHAALRNITTEVTTLAATFSPGSGYSPGTYSMALLQGLSGTYYYPGNSVADYPQVTIVVGTGGSVSSVSLNPHSGGSVIPDAGVVLGPFVGGTYSYFLGTAYGTGFRINIASIGPAGEENTGLGYQSLYNVKTGSRNVALGSKSGSNWNLQNVNDSIYIGYNANSSIFGPWDVSNEIVIGASASGNGSNTVTLGNDNIQKTYLKGNVGIGTDPSTKLHIYATQSGAFRLEDGAQSYPGYVLTSDSNGVGTWQGNTQVTITSATATALATWNNTTVMCNRSGACTITIPDTGLPPNFSFRFIVISSNTSATVTFATASSSNILPNTLLTFAQYESGVIDRLGTSSNYYITY